MFISRVGYHDWNASQGFTAQSVEQCTGITKVIGSNPVFSG